MTIAEATTPRAQSTGSLASLRREVRQEVITRRGSFSFAAARDFVIHSGRAIADSKGLGWHKTRMTGPVQVVDFFSGCGGMSAGFHAFNTVFPAFDIRLGIDSDEIANRTYRKNFDAPALELDIHQLARDHRHLSSVINDHVNRRFPLVLIGCSPCQGFSSHRNEHEVHDARNSLFADFVDIACQLRPDAVVIENVPELVTTRYWGFAEYALQNLSDSGYFVNLSVHDLTSFSVPQHRYRALLVAMKTPHSEPDSPESPRIRTVRDAIGDLPAIKAGETIESDPLHYTARHRQSTVETIRAVPLDGGNRPFDVGPECLRRARDKQGRGAYDDVYGRLAWDKPAITITAHARNPASGRFSHPEQHRGLSVREAARLQGFPDGFQFEGTLDRRFRQIGNAVPPPFACNVASHVLAHLLFPQRSAGRHDKGVVQPLANSFARVIPALKAGHLPVRPMEPRSAAS